MLNMGLPPHRVAPTLSVMTTSKRRSRAVGLPHAQPARLWDAIGDQLDRFTPRECANYLANAGYVPLIRDTL
jgi:hypothetical protein